MTKLHLIIFSSLVLGASAIPGPLGAVHNSLAAPNTAPMTAHARENLHVAQSVACYNEYWQLNETFRWCMHWHGDIDAHVDVDGLSWFALDRGQQEFGPHSYFLDMYKGSCYKTTYEDAYGITVAEATCPETSPATAVMLETEKEQVGALKSELRARQAASNLRGKLAGAAASSQRGGWDVPHIHLPKPHIHLPAVTPPPTTDDDTKITVENCDKLEFSSPACIKVKASWMASDPEKDPKSGDLEEENKDLNALCCAKGQASPCDTDDKKKHCTMDPTANVFSSFGIFLLEDKNIENIDIPLFKSLDEKYLEALEMFGGKLHAHGETWGPVTADMKYVSYMIREDLQSDYVFADHTEDDHEVYAPGIFLEHHDFAHYYANVERNAPNCDACGIILGVGDVHPKDKTTTLTTFTLASFAVPYGYTLEVPAGVIHGDWTFLGTEGISISDQITANTVYIRNGDQGSKDLTLPTVKLVDADEKDGMTGQTQPVAIGCGHAVGCTEHSI